MQPQADRPRLFSSERWRAAHDPRIDVAYVVAALAILAGISAFDTDTSAMPKTVQTSPR
jgi:hypothetical protein